jgi:rhodanese-related sulfurtransferase
MEWYLPLIWAGIIGSAVVLYVILDGFDLGIGMLFPFAKDDKERDQMMASIAPFKYFAAPVVAFCVYGFHVGCQTVATLRKAGFDARYMAGGHFAWKAIKGPVKLFESTTPSKT